MLPDRPNRTAERDYKKRKRLKAEGFQIVILSIVWGLTFPALSAPGDLEAVSTTPPSKQREPADCERALSPNSSPPSEALVVSASQWGGGRTQTLVTPMGTQPHDSEPQGLQPSNTPPSIRQNRELPRGWHYVSGPRVTSDGFIIYITNNNPRDNDPQTGSTAHRANYLNVVTGKLLLPQDSPSDEDPTPQILSGFGFSNGRALVRTNNGSAIIDEKGNFTMTEQPVSWRDQKFTFGLTRAFLWHDHGESALAGETGTNNNQRGTHQHDTNGGEESSVEYAETVYVDEAGKIIRPRVAINEQLSPGTLPEDNSSGSLSALKGEIGPYSSWGWIRFSTVLKDSNSNEERWGFMNSNFEIQVPPEYVAASDFHRGWAWVFDGRNWYSVSQWGQRKKLDFHFMPQPIAGTDYFYVVSRNRNTAWIVLGTGEKVMEIPRPSGVRKAEPGASLPTVYPDLSKRPPLEGLLTSNSNSALVPVEGDFGLRIVSLGDDLLAFQVGYTPNNNYVFNLKTKKVEPDWMTNARFEGPFTGDYAPVTLSYKTTQGSRVDFKTYIHRRGHIVTFGPLKPGP